MNTYFAWGCDTISTFVGCGLHESILVLYYYMYESMLLYYYYTWIIMCTNEDVYTL